MFYSVRRIYTDIPPPFLWMKMKNFRHTKDIIQVVWIHYHFGVTIEKTTESTRNVGTILHHSPLPAGNYVQFYKRQRLAIYVLVYMWENVIPRTTSVNFANVQQSPLIRSCVSLWLRGLSLGEWRNIFSSQQRLMSRMKCRAVPQQIYVPKCFTMFVYVDGGKWKKGKKWGKR